MSEYLDIIYGRKNFDINKSDDIIKKETSNFLINIKKKKNKLKIVSDQKEMQKGLSTINQPIINMNNTNNNDQTDYLYEENELPEFKYFYEKNINIIKIRLEKLKNILKDYIDSNSNDIDSINELKQEIAYDEKNLEEILKMREMNINMKKAYKGKFNTLKTDNEKINQELNKNIALLNENKNLNNDEKKKLTDELNKIKKEHDQKILEIENETIVKLNKKDMEYNNILNKNSSLIEENNKNIIKSNKLNDENLLLNNKINDYEKLIKNNKIEFDTKYNETISNYDKKIKELQNNLSNTKKDTSLSKSEKENLINEYDIKIKNLNQEIEKYKDDKSKNDNNYLKLDEMNKELNKKLKQIENNNKLSQDEKNKLFDEETSKLNQKLKLIKLFNIINSKRSQNILGSFNKINTYKYMSNLYKRFTKEVNNTINSNKKISDDYILKLQNEFNQTINDKVNAIQNKDYEIQNNKTYIENLQNLLNQKEHNLTNFINNEKNYELNFQKLINDSKIKDDQISNLITERDKLSNQFNNLINEGNTIISNKDNEITNLKNQIYQKDIQLSNRYRKILPMKRPLLKENEVIENSNPLRLKLTEKNIFSYDYFIKNNMNIINDSSAPSEIKIEAQESVNNFVNEIINNEAQESVNNNINENNNQPVEDNKSTPNLSPNITPKNSPKNNPKNENEMEMDKNDYEEEEEEKENINENNNDENDNNFIKNFYSNDQSIDDVKLYLNKKYKDLLYNNNHIKFNTNFTNKKSLEDLVANKKIYTVNEGQGPHMIVERINPLKLGIYFYDLFLAMVSNDDNITNIKNKFYDKASGSKTDFNTANIMIIRNARDLFKIAFGNDMESFGKLTKDIFDINKKIYGNKLKDNNLLMAQYDYTDRDFNKEDQKEKFKNIQINQEYLNEEEYKSFTNKELIAIIEDFITNNPENIFKPYKRLKKNELLEYIKEYDIKVYKND